MQKLLCYFFNGECKLMYGGMRRKMCEEGKENNYKRVFTQQSRTPLGNKCNQWLGGIGLSSQKPMNYWGSRKYMMCWERRIEKLFIGPCLPLARASLQEALSPCLYWFVSAYVSRIPHWFNASVTTGIYQNGR